MGTLTGIEWCDHTFNPWIGCTKVSGACDHCYAEALALRWKWVEWGPGKPRLRTSAANWQKPLAWNKAAAAAGVRRRVFCASLADVFDAEVDDQWRIDLIFLIVETPHLDWLLLTKRPKVAADFFRRLEMVPPNVWLGTTVENQAMADLRIPILLSIPAKVRFLSMEPLLGPVDLTEIRIQLAAESFMTRNALHARDTLDKGSREHAIDWVITGGESGPKARSSEPDWFRGLRDQCQAAGVPFFFKQWGEWVPMMGHGKAFLRVGKKRAGALLDAREWREFPS